MSIAQLLSTNVDPLLTAELLDVFIQPGGRSGHGGISPWWFSLGWWWKTMAPWTHYWRLLPYLECVRSCHLRGGGQIRSLIIAVERSATQEFKQWCRGPKYHQLSKVNIPTYSKFFQTANAIRFMYRRKFRSQTSDNMDRWKAEQGRGREKRKIRRKKSRRERVRRKKMQMREKVGKSRNTVFFKWFVAPEGRKVGSLM